EHVLERERMGGVEREDEPFLGRRGLELEVEALAEFLAEREPPGLVDAASEGRVEHELHASRLVEEALEGDRRSRGHEAEAALRFAQVRRDLGGGLARKEVVALEEPDRGLERALSQG